MLAIGTLLLTGVSAKCEMSDITAIIAGGDSSDSQRRRLSDTAGMFGGLNPDCIPCVTECVTKAIMSGVTAETQGAEYYICFFGCAEKEFEGPCEVDDLVTIQEAQREFGSMFSGEGGLGDMTTIEEMLKNPYGSIDGLSKQCVTCQNTCVQETLAKALEALGDALTGALSGGDGNGADEVDFEAEMAKMGHCSSCCTGLDLGPLVAPGAGTCMQEFKAQIPAMFKGSSEGSSDNTMMIIGIVVGAFVFVLILTGVCYCKNKNSKLEEEGPSTPMRPATEGGEPSIVEA